MNGQLIGDIYQDGLQQGIANYIGNNTSFGQGVNGVSKLFGGSQLIGNPSNQLTPPNHDDSHFTQPDSNGIRWFNDKGKQASDDHIQQFSINQPEVSAPTSTDQNSSGNPGFLTGTTGGGQEALKDDGIIGKLFA